MASKPDLNSDHFVHDTRRLDQHFVDAATAQFIVGAAQILPDDVVLDIGAGTGVLTTAILKEPSTRVIAVEADRRCSPYLDRLRRDHADLMIKLDRIQHIPLSDLAATSLIIANPPFSALEHLTRLIRELPQLRQAIICVGQRWAAAALAETGSPDYGVSSVAIRSRFTVHMVGWIDGTAFTPPIRQPAALLHLGRSPHPDPGLDLLADAVLNHAGSRLKDLLRSRRLRRTIGVSRQHELLHESSIVILQQLRLKELTKDQLSQIASLMER